LFESQEFCPQVSAQKDWNENEKGSHLTPKPNDFQDVGFR